MSDSLTVISAVGSGLHMTTPCCFCFQHCGIYQEQGRGSPTIKQLNTEARSCRLLFRLTSQAVSWRMRALLQRGITGRHVRVSGKVTYFCSPLLVCWRESRVSLLSTRLVTLSRLTAGAKLYKPLPTRHVQMLYYACHLKMYSQFCLQFILFLQ